MEHNHTEVTLALAVRDYDRLRRIGRASYQSEQILYYNLPWALEDYDYNITTLLEHGHTPNIIVSGYPKQSLLTEYIIVKNDLMIDTLLRYGADINLGPPYALGELIQKLDHKQVSWSRYLQQDHPLFVRLIRLGAKTDPIIDYFIRQGIRISDMAFLLILHASTIGFDPCIAVQPKLAESSKYQQLITNHSQFTGELQNLLMISLVSWLLPDLIKVIGNYCYAPDFRFEWYLLMIKSESSYSCVVQ